MIDAAIDGTHPALQGVDLKYQSFATPGRRPGPAEHGTAIAALLAGRPDASRGWGGLLPGAHVAAAAIFEVDEQGKSIATARALLQAVEWMAEQGVKIVNLSMAGPDNGIVRLATERALQQGLMLVAAAGNGASATEWAYPAAYQDVIAVTAVSAERTVYAYANRGPYIDFAAPGVRLWTAVPGGGRFQSGTSFAAPYVTSMVALTLAGGAERTVEAVRSRLRRDAVDLGAPGRDDVFGWGLVRMQPACPETVKAASRH
jgi:subtilisin family serine protease